ncbi:DASH complex subunit Ask1-domain-containing protein [Daldinia vernicosa]|uniref:DASH complex subunit Ask1-domain-containing protein n=1 Tax=Daldinia vernicosa TaxID=114800 RepID=UPI0020081990|nr:DASH complex subunit Ask1-domain-containing protein [Daldinia vernicosa]KAI0844718.1 DASH complex subunit Ask1-domain-containing protein [Daldinia vernicosa]
MSRPGPSSARPLTLTEELEKLEQSITLTLQEIDHNFNKAHRIVTTSILPLVEQYGEHSKAVWEASKFWKQFFEASANVSLSGYEDLAGDGETTTAEETALEDTTSNYNDATADEDMTVEQSGYAEQHQEQHDMPDDSILDHAEITGSTPRAPSTKSLPHMKKPQFANFESPYEKLRRELKGEDTIFKDDLLADDDDSLELPVHTRASNQSRLPDMSMTPRSSSVLEEPAPKSAVSKHKDPLLHRILDKNYRLQATPHKTVALPLQSRGLRGRSPAKPVEGEEDRTRRALWAESPMSSPEIAMPKLRSDLYMSPIRLARGRPAISDTPRTPGVSVQTPGTARKTRDIFAEARDKGLSKGKAKKDPDEINWDSDDDDDFGGMSPPKTIQFALPPSKLMQTPAREASRRIVDDILITAGAAPDDSSEYSPTMVKMNQNILDDTF